MNNNEVKNKLALRNLVDTFSNLADVQDIAAQVQLFTEDAQVTSYAAGAVTSALKGRKALQEAFSHFLAQFEVVYHINGQQVVEINGDKATGIAYAQVVLIGMQNGKRTQIMQGVRYTDEYVKQEEQWLIASRQSDFVWTDAKVLN